MYVNKLNVEKNVVRPVHTAIGSDLGLNACCLEPILMCSEEKPCGYYLTSLLPLCMNGKGLIIFVIFFCYLFHLIRDKRTTHIRTLSKQPSYAWVQSVQVCEILSILFLYSQFLLFFMWSEENSVIQDCQNPWSSNHV